MRLQTSFRTLVNADITWPTKAKFVPSKFENLSLGIPVGALPKDLKSIDAPRGGLLSSGPSTILEDAAPSVIGAVSDAIAESKVSTRIGSLLRPLTKDN